MFLRYLLLSCVCLTGIVSSSQNFAPVWPIGACVQEVDTSCNTYARNNISIVTDSIYDHNGLIRVTRKELDLFGRPVVFDVWQPRLQNNRMIVEIGYDNENRIVNGQLTTKAGDRIIEIVAFVVHKFDSNGRVIRWEEKYLTPRIEPHFRNQDDLRWKYADTKAKEFASVSRADRLILVNDSGGWARVAYYFIGADTLGIQRQKMVNGVLVESIVLAHGRYGVSMSERWDGVVVTTRTWEENELIEYHVYRDSVEKGTLKYTFVYDWLVDTIHPEIRIRYGGNLSIEKKGKMVFEQKDNSVSGSEVPPPPPPPPDRSQYITGNAPGVTVGKYKTANGGTRFEYYNFAMRSVTPFLVVELDRRGIVTTIKQGQITIKRSVVIRT